MLDYLFHTLGLSQTATPTSMNPSPFSSLLSHFPPSGSVPPCPPPDSKDPLPSFWLKEFESPLSNRSEHDQLPQEADVVVIGSGLTGVCAVDRLVEKLSSIKGEGKIKVVVIEAREFCSGATARNGGHLTSSPLLSYATLTRLFGLEEARRCVALEQYSIDWIIETCEREGWTEEVELRKGGGNLHLFDDEGQARHSKIELDAARKAGENLDGFEWLNPGQVLERYQATSKAGGILIPGNNVYPLKLVSKLFERALSRASASESVSLELYTHCPVSGVAQSQSPSYSWSVSTPRGGIRAKHVLHCTNGHLSSVLPSFAYGPSRVLPTRGQVLSAVPSPSLSNWPKWTNAFSAEHPFDIYMFQRTLPGSRREIILGGCREESGEKEKYEFGKSNDGLGSIDRNVGMRLREYLEWQYPSIFDSGEEAKDKKERKEQWEVGQEWTGIMGFREGGIPIVGPLYIEGELQRNQWVAAGYSGHGMPRAPAAGHLLGSLVAHQLLKTDQPFRLPSHFPRHYLTTVSGEPEMEARLPTEAGWQEAKEGWVWVDESAKSNS